jgi:hypothetical protein
MVARQRLGRSVYRPGLSGGTTIALRRVDAKTIPRYFLGVQRVHTLLSADSGEAARL